MEVVSFQVLVGKPVWNLQQEELGRVVDVIVNDNDSASTYLILGVGGFLGLADKLVPVPWPVFKTNENSDVVMLDTSTDRLLAAPGFPRDGWEQRDGHDWQADATRYFVAQD